MCVCRFFLRNFVGGFHLKQRRKTWLAAQVAARRSANTVVEDDGHHVVIVDREAPRSEVDMVRSNFQVGEMMRFQLSKKLQSQSLEISIINNITLWGGNAILFQWWGSSHFRQFLLVSKFFGMIPRTSTMGRWVFNLCSCPC